MNLREISWGSVDWIQLAQDRDRWRAVVNTAMNLRFLAPRNYLLTYTWFSGTPYTGIQQNLSDEIHLQPYPTSSSQALLASHTLRVTSTCFVLACKSRIYLSLSINNNVPSFKCLLHQISVVPIIILNMM
jgi:hypothetical protein